MQDTTETGAKLKRYLLIGMILMFVLSPFLGTIPLAIVLFILYKLVDRSDIKIKSDKKMDLVSFVKNLQQYQDQQAAGSKPYIRVKQQSKTPSITYSRGSDDPLPYKIETTSKGWIFVVIMIVMVVGAYLYLINYESDLFDFLQELFDFLH